MASTSAEELNRFIEASKARLKTILERLQWTEQDVLKTNRKTALDWQGKEAAKIVDDPPLPESCAISNSLTLGETELQKLLDDPTVKVPERFSDLQVNFAREQKLKIYEHVVENTEKLKVEEVEVPALHDGQLTFADIVALKKREKKKGRRHRRSKPTHIEEVRGLLELQMQALQQYIQTKGSEKPSGFRNTESERIQSWSRSSSSRVDRNEVRIGEERTYADDRSRVRQNTPRHYENKGVNYKSHRIENKGVNYKSHRRKSRSRSRGRRSRSQSRETHYYHRRSQNHSKDRTSNHHKRRSRSREKAYQHRRKEDDQNKHDRRRRYDEHRSHNTERRRSRSREKHR